MREIKFREWETYRKTMAVGIREDYDDSVGFRFLHEEAGQRILMQYTGLKDKYGVEIYEGDILSYFGFEYEVIFEESAFGWYEGGQFYAFAEMAIDEIAKTKIIGNRYENPELSEGNQ